LLANSSHFAAASAPTYGRGGLATHSALRAALCKLEHAEDVQLYPSGLAALTGAIQALTGAGDEVLAVDTIYNPTRRFLSGTMARFGVATRYFPPSATAEDISELITPATRLIVLESPGSLTFDMQDVPAIAALARSLGVLTLIDNTYAAGVLFKPLDHHVDVSVQSLTKYVCGHSDVFMGMAATRGHATTALATSAHEIGWAVSPDDAYLALRGLRTLHARLALHGTSMLTVADWLALQPEVTGLLCPALPNDPGHALWSRDFSGACGLLSLTVDGDSRAVDALLDALQLFGLGYSWGGFESLIIPCDGQLVKRAHPVHRTGQMLRLHIGLEHPLDLIADLRRGLDAFAATARLSKQKQEMTAA
jgi:cystathionine beta-lyase